MLEIRSLTEEDKETFEKVFGETVQKEFPEYTEKTRDFFITPKYLARMWELPVKFGAFEEGKMLGYIIGDSHMGGVAPVFWLAVLVSNQKQGIGTQLLEYYEKWAVEQGFHNIFLYSPDRNLDFYKARGYELIGQHKHGYFDVDDWILAKTIAEPKEENFLK